MKILGVEMLEIPRGNGATTTYIPAHMIESFDEIDDPEGGGRVTYTINVHGLNPIKITDEAAAAFIHSQLFPTK